MRRAGRRLNRGAELNLYLRESVHAVTVAQLTGYHFAAECSSRVADGGSAYLEGYGLGAKSIGRSIGLCRGWRCSIHIDTFAVDAGGS